MRKLLVVLVIVGTSGCPDVDVDKDETTPFVPGPTVEFDPASSIIPFPNNLLLCPASGTSLAGLPCTPGRVAIPPAACETPTAAALREGTLNQLNGFGTFEAAQVVTFTEPVDAATLDGHIVMFEIASRGVAVDPATAQPIPLQLRTGTSLRFTEGACDTPAFVSNAVAVPLVPLDERSTYVVAVLAGIKTMTGADYQPSFTWALIRQAQSPVILDANGNVLVNRTPLNPTGDANHNGIPDLQELQGLAAIWQVHAPALAFLGAVGFTDRDAILVAWTVTTQTTTDPLDPMVAGSPASALPTTPILGMTSVVPGGGANSVAFLQGVLQLLGAASSPAAAAATCAKIHCAAVGDVFGGALPAQNYLTHEPNPLPGGIDLPGPWTDPYMPAEQPPFATASSAPVGTIPVLAFIPAGPTPARGWPVVVFSHAISSQKESLFLFAPQLAAAGFASIAIDDAAHGARAIRISTDPAIGCANVGHCAGTGTACDPTAPGGAVCSAADTCVGYSSFSAAPQCYAPFLSPALATDRDLIRQSVLDSERLILAVKSCDALRCGSFLVDSEHIVYAGQSLGGVLGGMTVAAAVDIRDALLNTAAVGWLDIVENTQTLAITCPLVNGLIDAGIVVGEKWNGSLTNPTGLCTTNAWQQQPGYQQFSVIARWVLDPGEPGNFMALILGAMKKVLLQEVVGDTVFPNIATQHEGALLGLPPMGADPFAPTTTTASAAILNRPNESKWLTYTSLPAGDPSTGGFGNLYAHPSLLVPAPAVGHCAASPATECSVDSTCPGVPVCVFPGALGTARMQLDAITYLVFNH